MIERDVFRFLGQLHDAAGTGQILDGELCVLSSTIILGGGGVRVLLRAGFQTPSRWQCLNCWLGDIPPALCAEMAERADELARLAYWGQRLRLAATALGLTVKQSLPVPLLNPLKT